MALTLASIATVWQEMTRMVGQRNKNLPALLIMCKPLVIENNTIIIGFDYPLIHEKFSKTEGALDLVINAFRVLSGTDCLVRTVTTSEYPMPISREEFHTFASELGGVVRDK